jgi:hypothetical protein
MRHRSSSKAPVTPARGSAEIAPAGFLTENITKFITGFPSAIENKSARIDDVAAILDQLIAKLLEAEHAYLQDEKSVVHGFIITFIANRGRIAARKAGSESIFDDDIDKNIRKISTSLKFDSASIHAPVKPSPVREEGALLDPLVAKLTEALHEAERNAPKLVPEIARVIALAKGEVALRQDAPPPELSDANLGPALPELSEEAIAAIKARAKACPWSERAPSDKRNAFEWVRDNYGEWIPGLLQSHLRNVDLPLWQSFQTRLNRDGLPQWLDVPSQKKARERAASPELRSKILASREITKLAMRNLRRAKGPS